MKILALAAILLLTLSSVGCFRHTLHSGSGGHIEQSSRKQHHFIGGIIGTGNTDLDNVCKSKNFTLKTSHSFLDLILGAITSGIYTPTTTKVYCGK